MLTIAFLRSCSPPSIFLDVSIGSGVSDDPLRGLDLGVQVVKRLVQVVIDHFTLRGPVDQHRKVLTAPPERIEERAVILEPATALEHALCGGLVFPEVWRSRLGF